MELISLPVGKGEVDQVGLATSQKVGTVQKKGEKTNLTTKATATKFITAPIKKGDKLGELTLFKDGKEIDKIDLVANQDVGRGSLGRQIMKMMRQVVLAQK